MAKMNLLEALQAALQATKAYIDDNHYIVSEIDALLALKSDTTHTHNYAGSSSAGGAATSANKVNTNLAIKLNGGTTEGTNLFTFNGSAAKTIDITPSAIGAAAESHGTHVSFSTEYPKSAGTAAPGYSGSVARADHIHPAQTTISGNAGSASKVNNNMIVKLNGGTTEGSNMFTFNGSATKTVDITPAGIGASASGHNHDDRYYTESEINAKITTINSAISTAQTDATNSAKTYTDTAIANLVDSAPDAMNTLNELANAISDHQDVYDAYVEEISTALAGKANSSHGNHVPATQTANNAVFLRNDNTWQTVTPANIGAAKASHGTHVTYATNVPSANGTAAVGSANRVAREDHVHPLQTSVSGNAGSANKVNNALSIQLNGGTATSFDGSAAANINITPASIGAAASHNHDAYVNKNAFANVKVGSTTIAADAVQDTIELVAGSNITITPDATNDKITIAATDTVYTHPSEGANTGSFGNSANQTPAYGATFNVPYITVNAAGHVTAIKNTTVKIPASDKVSVTNNLTSTSTTAALSANQGYVLKGMVDLKADMVEDTDLTAMLTEVFGE